MLSVNSFAKTNDFTGKTVIPFCASVSFEMGERGELAGTGDWLGFRSGVSDEDVTIWVESLGL